MAIIKKEDIRGYHIDGRLICPGCTTEDDLKSLKEDELLMDDHLKRSDEVLYFCDECKKLL